jgi:hypothetical protein
VDLGTKTTSFFENLSSEVNENSIGPVVLIFMLLVYQITRNF